jgi:antirestriction protein
VREINEGDSIIDSRDVIKRIEELKDERAACTSTESTPEEIERSLAEWDDGEEGEELAKLMKLADEGEGSPDWEYGECLISDAHFEEYARELAEDIGALPKDSSWPGCYIDWEAAADALKQDYMSVEYGSTTYWIRA